MDIYLTKKLGISNQEGSHLRMPEKYYWYWYPDFWNSLKHETGEWVELYDDTIFTGDDLTKAKKLFVEELDKVKKRLEDSWKVHTGTQTLPEHKEIYVDISKSEFVDFIGKLLQFFDLAIERSEQVQFIGD